MNHLPTRSTWKRDALEAALFLTGLLAGLLWTVSPWLILALSLLAFTVFVVRFRHHRGAPVRFKVLPLRRKRGV